MNTNPKPWIIALIIWAVISAFLIKAEHDRISMSESEMAFYKTIGSFK